MEFLRSCLEPLRSKNIEQIFDKSEKLRKSISKVI
jgi:hypothetical protein